MRVHLPHIKIFSADNLWRAVPEPESNKEEEEKEQLFRARGFTRRRLGGIGFEQNTSHTVRLNLLLFFLLLSSLELSDPKVYVP